MAKDADDKTAITKVILRPKTSFSGDKIPAQAKIESMHNRAHELCFIANSVKTEVVTEILS